MRRFEFLRLLGVKPIASMDRSASPPECGGVRTPHRWQFWRSRVVVAAEGYEMHGKIQEIAPPVLVEDGVYELAPLPHRTHTSGFDGDGDNYVSSAAATASRHLRMRTRGDWLVQCANGRWHDRDDLYDGRCDFGAMNYYDARAAHEAARRLRYRIPQWWEWAVLGVLVLGEALRLVVGDGGLLP